MPKREWTYSKLKQDLEDGSLSPDGIYRLTVSLTYSQLLDFLDLREILKKSTSEMVRDGIATLKKQYFRDKLPPSVDFQQVKDELMKEQEKLKVELLNGVRSSAKEEESSPDQQDVLRGRITMFLEEFGALTTKDLARYVGVDCALLIKHASLWLGIR